MTVYVTLPPGVYVALPSSFVTLRSADADRVSVSVALLFPLLGSVTPTGGVMLAVLTRSPVALVLMSPVTV
jgi:hypothetical protein